MIEGSTETTRIERDLEETRARLDATIGALQDKLSPGQLLDQSLAYLKDSGGGEFVHNLKYNVQTHPMPVALIGIGLAWLMMGGNGRSAPAAHVAGTTGDWRGHYGTEGEDPTTGHRYGSERGYASEVIARAEAAANQVKRSASETAEAFQERLYDAKATALGISRGIGETVQDFGGRIDAAMRSAGRGGRAAAHEVRDAAGSAARATGRAASHAADTASRAASYLQDQPLLLGALGVSVGALLAAVLPPTRTEDQLMGEVRDNLRDRAGSVAGAALASGMRVADEAIAAGTETARREGLTGSEATDVAGRAAGKVADAASSAERVIEDGLRAGRDALDRELGRNEAGRTETSRVAAGASSAERGV